jgi:cytochrome P450
LFDIHPSFSDEALLRECRRLRITMTIDLLNAAWAPDPYPLYAELRQRHPGGVFFDDASGLWVACSAHSVVQALRAPELRVRPPREPVPVPLCGRASGDVLAGLMRFNDGPRHAQPRAWALPLLAELERAPCALDRPPATLDDAMFEAPLRLLAAGLGRADGSAIAHDVRALLAGWASSADDVALEAADGAARKLLDRFDGEANRVGLFTQTCEATAALIGNALVAWQREPTIAFDTTSLDTVARRDPPVQNTRRFAAEALELCGQPLPEGSTLLLLLASAEHDAPHERFGWGQGVHACPGRRLSLKLASAVLCALRDDREEALRAATREWHYRPSPNLRLPVFEGELP